MTGKEKEGNRGRRGPLGENGVKEQVPHEYSRREKAVMKHITLYANWKKKQKKISVDNLSSMNKANSTLLCASPNIPVFRIKMRLCEGRRHYFAQQRKFRNLV